MDVVSSAEAACSKFHGEAVAGEERSGCMNQARREDGVSALVAGFVGIGQRAHGDMAAYAQVKELGLMGGQADFDIAQAYAISQLCESQAEKLVEMQKGLDWIFGRILPYAAAKRVER